MHCCKVANPQLRPISSYKAHHEEGEFDWASDGVATEIKTPDAASRDSNVRIVVSS